MMEEMVRELKKVISFKDTTSEGDVVLIAIEKPQSVVYAIVTAIIRDEGKKQEWWNVGLHLLTVPPQQVTWTLREPQFTGQEIFTMGDEGRFMKAISYGENDPPKSRSNKDVPKKKVSRVTSLRLVK